MARSKSVKEFARAYDRLELLTHTNADIQLGDLYDKKGMFNNRLDFAGFNIAFKMGLSATKAKSLKERLKEIEAVEGTFQQTVIKDEFSMTGDMLLPSVNVNLSGKIDRQKVKHFEFGKIKTRVLRDMIRLEVEEGIEDFKDENKKEYKRDLKNLFIVEQLFYSDEVNVTIEKDVQVELDMFSEATGEVGMELDRHKNTVVTIQGSDWPFAMDLKKVKKFI